MLWYEIIIRTTKEACDAITEMLSNVGARGISVKDPEEIKRKLSDPNSLDYLDDKFINSLEEDITVTSYFPGDKNINELEGILKEKLNFISGFLHTGKGYQGYNEVDDEGWSSSWKKFYKPFFLTDKVVIKPSWEDYNKVSDEVVIELDPGMAFGTGTHETTKLCSVLLDRYLSKGDKVLDLGCGSGILGIVASKMGASTVTSVDIDEVAVKVTRENSEINKVDNLNTITGVIEDIEDNNFDIIVANIVADVIIDVGEKIPHYLKNGGIIIASGIICERKQEVLDTYLKLGFEWVETEELGEWVAIVLKCQDSL